MRMSEGREAPRAGRGCVACDDARPSSNGGDRGEVEELTAGRCGCASSRGGGRVLRTWGAGAGSGWAGILKMRETKHADT